MKSQKPYLIQAIYNWISDNGWTPHLLVKADYPGVQVPTAYVQEGRIVLNVSMTSVHGLQLDLDLIQFSARFGGNPMQIFIPPAAVLAIYARENGQGMAFNDEPELPPTDEPSAESSEPARKRPSLKVVK